MAIHDLYKRIAEELKKDANFWDRHSTLINEAYESATASEKRLIDDAMQATRKDRMLTELSVRMLNGDDELYGVKPAKSRAQILKELTPGLEQIFIDEYAKYKTKNRYNV